MACLYRRNGIWVVKFFDLRTRKWVQKSCKTKLKSEANGYLREALKIENGERISFKDRESALNNVANGGQITFRQAVTIYLESAKLKNCSNWHRVKAWCIERNLISFFKESTPINNIDAQSIESYQSHRSVHIPTPSTKTINYEIMILRAILRFARDRGYISIIPSVAKLPESAGRIRFLDRKEIADLLTELDRQLYSRKAYVMLMLYAGLRSGEAFKIRWIDVDLDGKKLHVEVRDGWKPKSGKRRSVPLTEKLFEFLVDAEKGRGEKNRLYIVSDLNHENIERSFRSIVRAAGLPISGENKVTAHTLRHTFASHLVMGGVPIYTVSKLLGHSDSKTTEIYAHLAPDYLAGAADKLGY